MTLTHGTAPTPAPEPIDDSPPALEPALLRAGAALSDEQAREAARLLDRWRSRSFVALIVGEFKRGKSTLLNALVGRDILPTGVPPVTAVPTRVRSGPRARAVARFRDGTEREIGFDEVRDYVDESHNPGNDRGVVSVDVEVPEGPPPGVVLVDVPGLGTTHAHNTEAALAALPEADAVVLVASVDPPVGEGELKLLRRVREHAARVDVVLNKIDYLDEKGRRAAEDFTRCTLGQQGFGEVAVWPVSARDGLAARASHDEVGWQRSGMEALAASLARFFEEERTALLARSLAKKAGRLVAQEAALVEMQLAAAERSAESFIGTSIPAEARRLAAAYGELSAEVGQAAAERARAVWRLAADLLPFEPPGVGPPAPPPAPRPAGFQLGCLRLLLDDLEDAAALLLPRGAALRRLAAQAREEADGGYGQVVERSREAFSRAYEENFGAVLKAYDQASKQTALAVESALAVAEERARSLDTDRRASASADELRRAALADIRDALKRIEGEGA